MSDMLYNNACENGSINGAMLNNCFVVVYMNKDMVCICTTRDASMILCTFCVATKHSYYMSFALLYYVLLRYSMYRERTSTYNNFTMNENTVNEMEIDLSKKKRKLKLDTIYFYYTYTLNVFVCNSWCIVLLSHTIGYCHMYFVIHV